MNECGGLLVVVSWYWTSRQCRVITGRTRDWATRLLSERVAWGRVL